MLWETRFFFRAVRTLHTWFVFFSYSSIQGGSNNLHALPPKRKSHLGQSSWQASTAIRDQRKLRILFKTRKVTVLRALCFVNVWKLLLKITCPCIFACFPTKNATRRVIVGPELPPTVLVLKIFSKKQYNSSILYIYIQRVCNWCC